MATPTQSNHLNPTKARPIPPHSHPIHLIKRGSRTACNHKLGYHDSCILCKGSVLYPRVVISLLAKRIYKPSFYHSYTSFGVWPRDHYMPLQRLDCMSCFTIGFPLLGTTEYPQAPFVVAKVFPYWVQQNTLRPLLHLVVS
jgi:hypothetical protein